ncbi:hypothetical protein DDZ18_09445 [Marinicauda salina]|uniref:Uncharacterized protein n=1 Tax=Marinicauda salina TaxID=2135793 RepID=A0A2U2BSG9_9PROT|nr:hypothetical protein [Marinicauda salina]PWE16926.1 hypothetical protein DDZ18_09445 [Marinicauda salina]
MAHRLKSWARAAAAAPALLALAAAGAAAQDATTADQPVEDAAFQMQLDRVDFQAVDAIEGQIRDRMVLDQAILERLQEMETEDEQPAAPERDADGRLLAPINWDQARYDLSAQMERDSAELTTAAAIQRPPTPEMVNIDPEELQRPRLPMLVPRVADARTASVDQGGVSGMLVFPRDHVYAASMHVGDLAIETTGSRIINVPEGDARLVRRILSARDADGVTVTRTRFGVELSFTRYGAAYSIQVMCEDPENNAACRDPETARSIYRRLAIGGGAPGPQGTPQ